MTRTDAIKFIDDHKNKLIDPVEMLMWTWIRVILSNLSDEAWSEALLKSQETLSR